MCKEEECSFLIKGLEMISNKQKILNLLSLETNAKLFSVFVLNHTHLPFLAKIDLSDMMINSFQVAFLLWKCDNLIEISSQNCRDVTDHVFQHIHMEANYLWRSS